MKRVKTYARENYEKPAPRSDAVMVALDEMWHFLFLKKEKSEFGNLIVAIPLNLSTGNMEGETIMHFLKLCLVGQLR